MTIASYKKKHVFTEMTRVHSKNQEKCHKKAKLKQLHRHLTVAANDVKDKKDKENQLLLLLLLFLSFFRHFLLMFLKPLSCTIREAQELFRTFDDARFLHNVYIFHQKPRVISS